jgi:hypothetical protein
VKDTGSTATVENTLFPNCTLPTSVDSFSSLIGTTGPTESRRVITSQGTELRRFYRMAASQ